MTKVKPKGIFKRAGLTTLAFLIATTSSYALENKSITVAQNGIKLVVDGKNVQFGTDISGNPITPFIYNGTTYLPIKAVGEALEKPVSWDAKTQTVYVGLRPEKVNYMTEIIEPYATSSKGMTYKLDSPKSFSMGGKNYNTGYVMGGYSDDYAIFNLDGKYEEISGILGAIRWKYTVNRDFDIYLDGELYKSITVELMDLPQEIKIPVKGVNQLKIESQFTGKNHGDTYIGFGDVTIK